MHAIDPFPEKWHAVTVINEEIILEKKRSLNKSTEKVQNLPNDTLDHIAKISSMSRKGRPE